MKKSIFTLLFIIFVQGISFGKYRQECKVKYKEGYSWSKKYSVEVTFLSGYELNEATSSFNYSSSSVYAAIFWGQGKATIIKVKNILLCGTTVTSDCIKNSVLDLEGEDQDGDIWNICVSNVCF